MIVDYAPVSAEVLVQQAAALDELSDLGTINPEILAKAQVALEHDMAFYALTQEEVSALYDRIVADWQALGQTLPPFEEIDLEITPEAEAAAQFIIDLLIGK
jgi:hypothetical protein